MHPSPDTRTRLLDGALRVIRRQGFAATTVDELCRAAGVSKGAFFHHFKSKEDLAIAAATYWNEVTGDLFSHADYQQVADPRARLLAYIDLRSALLQGTPAEFSCLLGTMAQETFAEFPKIRQACGDGITDHAATLVDTIASAKARYAPNADWDPASLALYTQAAIQGAFILAKAKDDVAIAAQCIEHLRRYVQLLLPASPTHDP